MSWLHRLFRPHVELPPALARRVRAWRDLPPVPDRTALAETRFVVVDVETTGLDPRRDRLLSIGACVVENLRVLPGTNREWILRHEQATATRENILIHGLGPAAQAAGVAHEAALMEFLEYAGKAPLVAFHAAFDQAVLDRALRTGLGLRVLNPWLDLAPLAPVLAPEARLSRKGLDAWLAYFHLRAFARHGAAYDALATAELFLILLARAQLRGIGTLSALRAAAEVQVRAARGGVGG